ncbi:MAG: RNA pyrophosphohydrolase [Alphaproteobacteria bacterium]|nr:RNA pyrophosphohydrolase [Alphaproteobacteria bacterium]
MGKPARRPYRRSVGIMLFNDRGQVLVCQRFDQSGPAWQMPQGGIDGTESPRAAALRELEEEVGTANATVVAATKGWLTYDLPAALQRKAWGGRYRGQKQKWFAMRFLGTDHEIRLDSHHEPEFSAWRWIDPAKLPRLAVEFKRSLYEDVLREFSPEIGAAKLKLRRAPKSAGARGTATRRRG